MPDGREREDEEEGILGLGGVPREEIPVGVVLKVRSRIAGALYEHHGKKSICYLKTRATHTKGERTFVRFKGARRKGAIVWITCQVIHTPKRADDRRSIQANPRMLPWLQWPWCPDRGGDTTPGVVGPWREVTR